MAHKQEVDGTGWTLRSLKEYTDQRFDDARSALDKASSALEYRLEQMNQFRQQIERERSEFVTLDKHDELDNKIDEIRRTYVTAERMEALDKKTDAALKPINEYMASQLGKREGIGSVSAILYALLVLAVSMLTVFIIYYTRPHTAATPPAQTVTVTVPASTTP